MQGQGEAAKRQRKVEVKAVKRRWETVKGQGEAAKRQRKVEVKAVKRRWETVKGQGEAGKRFELSLSGELVVAAAFGRLATPRGLP